MKSFSDYSDDEILQIALVYSDMTRVNIVAIYRESGLSAAVQSVRNVLPVDIVTASIYTKCILRAEGEI